MEKSEKTEICFIADVCTSLAFDIVNTMVPHWEENDGAKIWFVDVSHQEDFIVENPYFIYMYKWDSSLLWPNVTRYRLYEVHKMGRKRLPKQNFLHKSHLCFNNHVGPTPSVVQMKPVIMPTLWWIKRRHSLLILECLITLKLSEKP